MMKLVLILLISFALPAYATSGEVNAKCSVMSILAIDVETGDVEKIPSLNTEWQFSYAPSEDNVLWFSANTGEHGSETNRMALKILEKDTQHLVAANLFSRGYIIYTLSLVSSSVHAYLYEQKTEENPKGTGRQYFASCRISQAQGT